MGSKVSESISYHILYKVANCKLSVKDMHKELRQRLQVASVKNHLMFHLRHKHEHLTGLENAAEITFDVLVKLEYLQGLITPAHLLKVGLNSWADTMPKDQTTLVKRGKSKSTQMLKLFDALPPALRSFVDNVVLAIQVKARPTTVVLTSTVKDVAGLHLCASIPRGPVKDGCASSTPKHDLTAAVLKIDLMDSDATKTLQGKFDYVAGVMHLPNGQQGRGGTDCGLNPGVTEAQLARMLGAAKTMTTSQTLALRVLLIHSSTCI